MLKLFGFLNLLDAEGNLSITNVAVILVLIKLAFSPTASLTEAGMLLATLANYAHKRSTKQIKEEEVEEDLITPQVNQMQQKLNDMATQVSAMSIQSGIKKLSN